MRKLRLQTLLVFLFLSATQLSLAQKRYIKFDVKNCSSFTHPLAEVKVLDMRSDTNAIIGRLRIGLMNAQQPIQTEEPLAVAIKQYYLSLSSNKPSSAKLIVLLYTFFAHENKPGFSSESANFNYMADYFLAEKDGPYRLLGKVDTTINVKSFDVTQKLLRTIDQSLCGLYEDLYALPQQNETYTYDEILNFENKKKKQIPAYANAIPENAVFKTWADFKMLNSKGNESVYLKRNKLKIKYFNANGQPKSTPANLAKIVVYESKLFYNLEGDFYEMYQKNGDYYIVGRTNRYNYNTNAVMMFGLVGALATSGAGGSRETYEFKINHQNGQLIPIRKVKL